MLHYLLSLDAELLIYARNSVWPEYSIIVQILGESIVIFVALMLIILWLYGVKIKNKEYKIQSLRIFMTIILIFIIYGIINLWLPQWRPSPDDIVGGIAPLIPHPIGNSFPSGHALFSAAAIVAVWRYFREYYTIMSLTILALLTAIARVIWWVHYPGDILGGFIVGSIGAIILVQYLITSELFESRVYPFFIRIASWIRL